MRRDIEGTVCAVRLWTPASWRHNRIQPPLTASLVRYHRCRSTGPGVRGVGGADRRGGPENPPEISSRGWGLRRVGGKLTCFEVTFPWAKEVISILVSYTTKVELYHVSRRGKEEGLDF